MKRWLAPMIVVLLLATLALSASRWLPPLVAFVTPNTDAIQGIEALVQIALLIGAAIVAAVRFARDRKPPGSREPRTSPVPKTDTGGGAFVGHDANTGGGKFVGGSDLSLTINAETVVMAADRLAREIRPSIPGDALQRVSVEYLNYLIDRHQHLNLKGMGVSDRVPLRLPLLDLYVPLKARLELPEGETWKRNLRLAGRLLGGEEQALAARLGEPQPVLHLLQQHDGLIILGDPGAGKTTFLKFLALTLALGAGEQIGLGHRLPILAPLSAYANALSERDVRLDDFIAEYFRDIGADLPIAALLQDALKQGKALILLDGLDEVKDMALRHIVVERVADFYTFRRRAGNKFVLTSRIVGYREVRPTAQGLAECTLIDFEDDEIADFVSKWTAALEKQAQGETTVARLDAEHERRELLDAVQRNTSVRTLASNPLLLTILALMKRQGVTLPERRVELYDQYVRTLLSSWNRARGLGRPPTRDLDVVQTLRILAPLALWMHEVNPGAGLVKREDLRRELMAICEQRGDADAEAAARQFLSDVHDHAGLLLERGPGEYGFIHLTFEEYLAGVAIALQGQRDIGPIVDHLANHVSDPAWREVALLTIGYLGIIQQRDEAAGAALESLIERKPGLPGEAAVLAGEATLDAWPGGVPPSTKERVIEALIPTMQSAEVKPAVRRQAGLLLGRLGWQPSDLDELVEVPAGKFLYGDADEKEEREIPYRYWIAKYPVTNLQYARFIAAGGYDDKQWWSEEGWAWRNGAQAGPDAYQWIDDEKLRRDVIEFINGRTVEERSRPYWWDDAERSVSILPVVGVTWYEAEAYCNWLNSVLTKIRLDANRSTPRPADVVVRLPREEEWERAARGADGREYPWEGAFDFSNANVAEETGKGIGATAVCAFPHGVSPAGAWDMSGNVWEWSISHWSSEETTRVVRGGAWNHDQRGARCAYRLRDEPDSFNVNIGFRVVVSLAF
ncbi:MAG TPA: SUMF1/EgtB/PvdO family nonheme iron enzyme [Anaerolineae bacterium]